MINFVAINSLDELTYECNGHDFSSLSLKQLSFKYPVFQVPGFYVISSTSTVELEVRTEYVR
jgi:hypothetical protein